MIKLSSVKISQICDDSFKMIEESAKQTEDGLFQYHILELTVNMFSNVIMEMFMGGDIRKQKIQGQSVGIFFSDLTRDAFNQIIDPTYLIFGINFLKLGLLKSHRSVTRRGAAYK